MEPITVARKPLIGTVAENVLRHGTGALNIDGCRVETTDNLNGGAYSNGAKDLSKATSYATGVNAGEFVQPAGRWPANLIHDGSEEVVGLFPDAGNGHWSYKPAKDGGIYKYGLKDMPDGGSDKTVSSAARFFYCAKASRSERNAGLDGLPTKHVGTYAQDAWSREHMGNTPDNERQPVHNHHPTVKPIALMRYLCRLVTPPGGIVLDPFMGSGSTGKAAVLEGFQFIGIERDAEYCEIAKARIAAVDVGLFGAAVSQ